VNLTLFLWICDKHLLTVDIKYCRKAHELYVQSSSKVERAQWMCKVKNILSSACWTDVRALSFYYVKYCCKYTLMKEETHFSWNLVDGRLTMELVSELMPRRV